MNKNGEKKLIKKENLSDLLPRLRSIWRALNNLDLDPVEEGFYFLVIRQDLYLRCEGGIIISELEST